MRPPPAPASRIAVGVAALSGFGTLALEVLYTRLFALVFQGVSHAEDVGRRVDGDARTLFGVPFRIDGREVRLARLDA